MRRPRQQFPELAAEITATSTATPPSTGSPHLLTDLAVDNNGRAGLTPYAAPSGKQNLRTFFSKPLHEVRASPGRIHEALTGWRRVEGFTGEYLDHHVLNAAADSPGWLRTAAESGVPGATWLATMALPVLPYIGSNGEVAHCEPNFCCVPLQRLPTRPARAVLRPASTPVDPAPASPPR